MHIEFDVDDVRGYHMIRGKGVRDRITIKVVNTQKSVQETEEVSNGQAKGKDHYWEKLRDW